MQYAWEKFDFYQSHLPCCFCSEPRALICFVFFCFLGVPTIALNDLDDLEKDVDILTPTFNRDAELHVFTPTSIRAVDIDVSSPSAALQLFQEGNVVQEPKQRIYVCRLDGVTDMRREIMAIYKNPETKLLAAPRAQFGKKEGVCSGPVRELLCNVIKIVEEEIPTSEKPLIFLEGESGHCLPIHDQSHRLTGSVKAVGRMIGHSLLHVGPFVYGLFPAVKHYFSTAANDKQLPPPLAIEDIADIELRQLLSEVSDNIKCTLHH